MRTLRENPAVKPGSVMSYLSPGFCSPFHESAPVA